MLRAGREECSAPAELPPSTERLLVGGIASLLAERLLLEEAARIPDLHEELLISLLAPYLGAGEARRVAVRCAPPRPTGERGAAGRLHAAAG